MKQILHILNKDLRRFRLEILVSVVLVAVFTWIEPKLWRSILISGSIRRLQNPAGIGFIELLLMLLIPISWWLFITRVVHEERLVGDRQFWITRPYEWKKLLGAKALIVACCVYLPLGTAQWWLLQLAGLQPATHIGALFYDWLPIALVFILPIAALAAVTRNFARMTLTLLGAFVASAVVAAILSALLENGVMHSPVEHNNPFNFPILLVICTVVIVMAYRTRWIFVARAILLCLPVLLILSSVLLSSDAMINHAYPESSNASIRFSLKEGAWPAHPAISSRQLYIQIPLSADGIVPGELWIGKGVRATAEAGNRTLWMSHWQPLNFYLRANAETFVGFDVDRAVFDRIQSQPVTLHLEIALDQAHREQVDTSRVSLQDVVIPRLGVCSSIANPERSGIVDGKPSPVIDGLACRSALREPQLTYVETVFTRGPCQTAPGNSPSPLEVQGTWIGNLSSEPAVLGITPVRFFSLPFSGNWTFNSTVKSVDFKHLCPGAPITFTRFGLLRHLRTELTIENFQFPSYDKREDAAH